LDKHAKLTSSLPIEAIINMNANAQPYLFLSYTRRDSDIMHRVRDTLRDEGLNVWVDEGIEPGMPLWDRAVEDGLKTAGCMVVILTPKVMDSKGVRDEIHFAGMQHVRIFTVLAQGEPSESIPYTLSGNQFVDIRTNYTTNMARLITAIQKHMELEPVESLEGLSNKSPVGQTQSNEIPAFTKPVPSQMRSTPKLGMKWVKIAISFIILIFGGFVLGAACGSLAYYKFLADTSKPEYARMYLETINLIIACAILVSLAFSFIRDWLSRENISKNCGLFIVSALVTDILTAVQNSILGVLYVVLMLSVSLYILPWLNGRLFQFVRRSRQFQR
jgi:hypothetical protein